MAPWLSAALPFLVAAVTQILGAAIGLGTSEASKAYFQIIESTEDYVPAEMVGNSEYTPTATRNHLPDRYFSENIGRVFAKNDDAATMLMGVVTLLATAAVTWPQMTGLSILLGVVAAAGGAIWAVRLLRRSVDEYKPHIFKRVPVSSTVVILVVVFLGCGVVAALTAHTLTPIVPAPVTTP